MILIYSCRGLNFLSDGLGGECSNTFYISTFAYFTSGEVGREVVERSVDCGRSAGYHKRGKREWEETAKDTEALAKLYGPLQYWA